MRLGVNSDVRGRLTCAYPSNVHDEHAWCPPKPMLFDRRADCLCAPRWYVIQVAVGVGYFLVVVAG